MELKKYRDEDRPWGMCYDCKTPYDQFTDLVIPDEVWEKINPTYHEDGGLLCPTCIGLRLRAIGINDVSAVLA